MPVVDPNVDPFSEENASPFVPASSIDTAPANVSDPANIVAQADQISGIDTAPARIPTYAVVQNAVTELWDVVDPNTGAVIAGNLPDRATAEEVLGLQQAAVSSPPVPQPQAAGIAARVKQAQRQQTLADQQRQLNKADWRLRLSLATQSDYLYNAAAPGILSYLKPTDGVIFPYTPQITTSYKANYSNYDLTHSNYRGYYYQNSYTDALTVTGTFTAQNTQEANYLLAVIHFFRSVTKMFYGQSQHVGSPPPICYLNGLGEYQFNKHPVLVTQFSYTLPNSVDYIRAGSPNNLQLNQNSLRPKTNTANPALSSVQRLATAFLNKGASQNTRPPPTGPNTNNPTYVPTKMDIVVTLMPVQSRTQVSQQFSLENFANGNLLRGGFW